MTTGEKVKKLCDERGITQGWLALKAGLSENEVNKIVINIRHPKLSTIYKLAKVLNVKPKELYSDDSPMLKEDLDKTIGGKVTRICALRDIKREELAKLSGVGITTVNRIIRNEIDINLHLLFKVAKALNVTPEELCSDNHPILNELSDQSTGGKIKRLCAEKGIKIGELAEMASVERSTIGNIIHKKRKPKELTLHNIAKALEVDVQDLF